MQSNKGVAFSKDMKKQKILLIKNLMSARVRTSAKIGSPPGVYAYNVKRDYRKETDASRDCSSNSCLCKRTGNASLSFYVWSQGI